MLGSHDSYTYLDAKNFFINQVSRYWRTQNKTIAEQYKFGVRFFDVRVKREVDNNGKTTWRTCHGSAEFSKVFSSIKSICVYFSNTLKGCKYRIWMEKGSDEDWALFKKEVLDLKDRFDGFVQSYRKSNYEQIFQKDTYPTIEYYACKMEDKKNWVKGIVGHPIKDWAKKHNPEITQEMIDDTNTVYLMDYVTGTE